MAKSKGHSPGGRGSFGFGRRGGTVTVIEDQVSRSYARTAKIAFYIIMTVVGLLAATVASSYWHPIIALAAGLGIGVATALPVAALIAAWPLLRVLWWWLPEITATALLVYGFTFLCQHTNLPIRITVVVALIAPAVHPNVRDHALKLVFCFVSRHRIRTCFAEFLIGNNRGSLPFILWARPTRVGESLWIWLRPGLSLDKLTTHLEEIAVACWADKVTIERASATNAAYLRIDITRRDGLTGMVKNDLLDDLGDVPTGTTVVLTGTPASDAAGLDLPGEQTTPPDPPKAVKNTANRSGNGKAAATAPPSDDDPYADYR